VRVVVVASVLLLAGLVYALVAWRGLGDADRGLELAAREEARVDQLIGRIRALEGGDVALEEIYWSSPFTELAIQRAAEEVGLEEFAPSVGQVQPRTIGRGGDLLRNTLLCSVNQAPIEEFLRWVDASMRVEVERMARGRRSGEEASMEGRIFLTKLNLTPINRDWQGSFELAWYEVR